MKLPIGVKGFEVWGRTIIKMDKYAKNKLSFAELVAFPHVDRKAIYDLYPMAHWEVCNTSFD